MSGSTARHSEMVWRWVLYSRCSLYSSFASARAALMVEWGIFVRYILELLLLFLIANEACPNGFAKMQGACGKV